MPNIFQTTWADIDVPVYDKRFGANSGSGTNSSASETVYYLVDYTNRWRFIRAAMGTPQALDYANPSSLLYRMPLQLPDNLALFAQKFDWTAIGSPTGVCASVFSPETAYKYAWVGLQYSSLTYNPVTLYSVENRTGSQEITAPNYYYSFVSDGLKIDQAVGVNVPNQEFAITFHRVPYFDGSTFVSYQGTVNATTFLGYAAGTVLFNPTVSHYDAGIGVGTPIYEVTLSFTWRSIPWNYFLRPGGSWAAVQDPASNPPFASSEFNNLIS